MTFRRQPQVAYHDLVSLLLDETVTDARGAPTARIAHSAPQFQMEPAISLPPLSEHDRERLR